MSKQQDDRLLSHLPHNERVKQEHIRQEIDADFAKLKTKCSWCGNTIGDPELSLKPGYHNQCYRVKLSIASSK